MNNQRPDFLVPALIGGSLAGVLSGIPLLNCLCCLWIIGGAVLSTYLLAKDRSGPLTSGDGAIVGALAGIVSAVVVSLIGIPLRAVNARFIQQMSDRIAEMAGEMPAGLEGLFDQGGMAQFSFSMFLFGLFISAAVFAAFGALGGVIGVSLFGRKKVLPSQGESDAPQNPGDRQP